MSILFFYLFLKIQYNTQTIKTGKTKFGWRKAMMETREMKEYCIEEIKKMTGYEPLLDIFYLIIQDQGKSYQSFRSTWIKARTQQKELSKES